MVSWQHAYRHILPPAFLGGLSVEKRQVTWAESIATDRPHVRVAEVEGRVFGISAFGPCRDENASDAAFEIWAIYLTPSHWSQGLGRELWRASREALLKRGARTGRVQIQEARFGQRLHG